MEDVVRFRDVPHVVRETILNTAYKDGRDVEIAFEMDPGALANAYIQQLRRELSEKGFVVRVIRPTKAKVQRFRPFAAIAESGFVNVVDADWTRDYLNELEAFTGSNTKVKDDQVDATSLATYFLTQEQALPIFSIPTDLTTQTTQTFGFQDSTIPTSMGLPTGFN